MNKIVTLAIIATLLAGQVHAEDTGQPGEGMASNTAVAGAAADAEGTGPARQEEARGKCTPARQQKTASSGLKILGGLLMFAGAIVGAVAPVGSGALTAAAAGALSADAAANAVSRREDRDCTETQRSDRNTQNSPS